MFVGRKIKMRSLFTLLLVMTLGSTQSFANQCGKDKVTIANMTWLSASVLAHLAGSILETGYDCTVELVPGDTVPTMATMISKSTPDIAPEIWTSSNGQAWNDGIKKGKVITAGKVFWQGGVEGWWVPEYTIKNNPGLRHVNDLKDHAHLFAEQGKSKGRVYQCPPGWACEISTANLFKALKLEDKYELFSSGSGANLKAVIARKSKRKEDFVTYYWDPTDVTGKYNLVRLEMPPVVQEEFDCLSSKECENPVVTGWVSSPVVVGLTGKFEKQATFDVKAFLSRFSMANKLMSQTLAWADDNSADAEDTTEYFLKTHGDIWKRWVSAEAAAKIEKSLL